MKPLTLLLILLILFGFAQVIQSEVPKLINYQGKLTTPQGAPLDTTVFMQFSIYPDSTGGTPLWTETQLTIRVDKGIFNTLLGSVTEIPDSVFNGAIRYLGVIVGADPEMMPRKPIVSVGYAYNADMVDGLHNSDIVQISGDQTIDGVKTFDSIPLLPAIDPTQDEQAVTKAYADRMKPLSNVIFCWNGVLNSGQYRTLYRGTGLTPNLYFGDGDNEFLGIYRPNSYPGYEQMLTSKWTKTPGISTVTVWCLIWQRSSNESVQCKVDIGSQSSYVVSDPGIQFPQWHSFTIDVSNLTDSNTYDIIIWLGYAADNSYYLGAIILVGN